MEANIGAIKLIDMLNQHDTNPYTNGELAVCLTRVQDDILIGIRQDAFFHHPRAMTKIVQTIPNDWGDVLTKFTSARREIE
jgi:hypothetical protein